MGPLTSTFSIMVNLTPYLLPTKLYSCAWVGGVSRGLELHLPGGSRGEQYRASDTINRRGSGCAAISDGHSLADLLRRAGLLGAKLRGGAGGGEGERAFEQLASLRLRYAAHNVINVARLLRFRGIGNPAAHLFAGGKAKSRGPAATQLAQAGCVACAGVLRYVPPHPHTHLVAGEGHDHEALARILVVQLDQLLVAGGGGESGPVGCECVR